MHPKFQLPLLARTRTVGHAAVVIALLGLVCVAPSGCGEGGSKPADTVRVASSAAAEKPPPSVVPNPRNDLHTLARRGAIRTRAERGDAEVVLLGDSITEGWSRSGHPVMARAFADVSVVNLGINGDRTDDVLGRLEGDLAGFDPAVVIVLIGTNNLTRDPPDDVVAGIGAVVERLHALRPDAGILLLELLPRGFEPDSAERRAVEIVNERLERAAHDWPVVVVDAGPALVESDGSMLPEVSPDALHLSAVGYERLWRAIEPRFERLLETARARRDGGVAEGAGTPPS